jgi:hypothetical protein
MVVCGGVGSTHGGSRLRPVEFDLNGVAAVAAAARVRCAPHELTVIRRSISQTLSLFVLCAWGSSAAGEMQPQQEHTVTGPHKNAGKSRLHTHNTKYETNFKQCYTLDAHTWKGYACSLHPFVKVAFSPK